MEYSCCKGDSQTLQSAVYRNAAAISSDNKYPWFTCRGFHLYTSEGGIVASLGDPVESADIFGSENFFRCTVFFYIFSVYADYFVGDFLGQIQFMEGHDHSKLIFQHHFFQNGEKLQLVADVQEGGRFIQYDDLRLLADCSGQKNPLALAVTDGCEIPVLQVPGMDGLHGCPDLLFI